MELIVLSQIMISLLMLALVSTYRLYQRRSLSSLSTEQPLLFSIYMTFLAAMVFVFGLYFLQLFISFTYVLGLIGYAVIFLMLIKHSGYTSTLWALALVGLVGTILMQLLFFINDYDVTAISSQR
ncbi:MAG: hypothetical protein EVB03_07920 [SAR92 clade bacterium]|uniref:Uncharacterized protein n=1 Tax=SAR92 clade bacterium TaxID=2315479 RepID=A0A520MDW4_9GAMM|nr:MAG: hypothetical protein EVB03_07920 [SAR92 clade bacterium]